MNQCTTLGGKSPIWETLNLQTDADSSSNTKKIVFSSSVFLVPFQAFMKNLKGWKIIDGVGLLITDPPLTSFTIWSKKEKKKIVTCDIWHVTRDTCIVTCDMGHMVGVNILSKFQLPRFYGLGKTVSWRFWTKGSVSYWIKLLLNYEPVYRTAPATPGLLIRGGGS